MNYLSPHSPAPRLSVLGILASLLAVPCAFGADADPLLLVSDHQSRAVIVVDRAATRQVRDAAATLQSYIAKSTGATLPIQDANADAGVPEQLAIHIGKTSYTERHLSTPATEDPDGFILQSMDANHYAIVGGSDWGTEFGVYDFLERYLGVRWLMPTDLGTEIPQHATLHIPRTTVHEQPTYLSRQLRPIEITREAPPKPYAPWRQYTLWDAWGRFNRARGRIEYHHNFRKLFPPSKFAATHPEFYPMIKGKRVIPKDDNDFRWQPNFSAPGIVDAAAHEIEQYFESHPEASSYSLGVNDLRFFDDTAESKARRSGKTNAFGYEDVSDDYFLWANAVVGQVSKRYPDKLYGLLAYSAVAAPPEKSGVASQIVPFITYERLRWADPVLREQDQAMTTSWGEVSKALGWYDYVYGRNYLTPRLWPHQMQEYLRWGAAHRVKYYTAELYPNWGEGPKAWVTTKLLWNPEQNVDALLDDWYQNAVGAEAAPKLRAYYALWEEFWTKDIFQQRWSQNSTTPAWNRRSGQYLPFEINTYLLAVPREYLTESRQLLEAALQLADTPRHKERVERLMEMWEIYELSILTCQEDNRWRTADLRDENEALELLKSIEKTIALTAKRQGLIESLKEDDLHGHSAYRIAVSENTNGGEWGATPLWSLVPWLARSPEVKDGVEKLAREGGTVQTRRLAAKVLKSADKETIQLLKNSSFEEGLKGWTTAPTRASGEIAMSGKHSLLAMGFREAEFSQSIPCEPGVYYGTVSAYLPESQSGQGEQTSRASLALATVNAQAQQAGRELPVVNIPLHPGKWSTFIIPFKLDKEVTRIPSGKLRVSILLNGFEPTNKIYFDDIQIFKID